MKYSWDPHFLVKVGRMYKIIQTDLSMSYNSRQHQKTGDFVATTKRSVVN